MTRNYDPDEQFSIGKTAPPPPPPPRPLMDPDEEFSIGKKAPTPPPPAPPRLDPDEAFSIGKKVPKPPAPPAKKKAEPVLDMRPKLPKSKEDEFTQSIKPTKEQIKVLGAEARLAQPSVIPKSKQTGLEEGLAEYAKVKQQWADIKAAAKAKGQTTEQYAKTQRQSEALEAVIKTVAPKGVAVFAAEVFVPGVYTIRHWDEMGTAEKAIMVAIDVVSIVPFAGAAMRGARAVPVAGKVARLAGAAKGVGAEAVLMARAPVDIVLHPVGTAKATVREARNLLENIAHPGKIPESVITTTNGTVRLKVTEATTPKRAMEIRDTLMDLAAKGERPVVKIGNVEVELARSPFMKETGGGLAHATPSGEAFKKGLTVQVKEGMPIGEQGLFMSHEPLPRFTEASAFGMKGEKPAFYIVSKETAKQAVATGKVFRGTTEMESKFVVGTRLPEPGQKLITRVGPAATKVEIFLENPLSPAQIVKLKAQALVETITTPFKPAITVRKVKGAAEGLDGVEVKKLVKLLKESGNEDVARTLLRSERTISQARAIIAPARRLIPPPLERVTGIRPDGRRITKQERVRAERAARAGVRVTEPGRGRDRLAGTEREPGRDVTREPGREPDREIAREAARKEGRAELRTEVTREPERDTVDRGVKRDTVDRGVKRDTVDRGIERDTVDRGIERDTVDRGRLREELTGEDIERLTTDRGRLREELTGEDIERLTTPGTSGKEWTPEEIKSAIGWKQGFVVYAIKSPYTSQKDVRTWPVKKAPAGLHMITIPKGEGSAAKSYIPLKGKPPSREVQVDIGITDALFSTKGLRFRGDPRQRTSGDINIKNLSTRQGRMFVTPVKGGKLLSRRPIKGLRK